jgi:single-strand DNA-binding protein
MSTINNVNEIGYLAADPELKALPSGDSVAELRLAVDQAGNTKDSAGYFNVAVYGTAGEAAVKYLSKGSHVAVHGRLQHRTWTAEDGASRQSVRIVGNVQFLDRKTPQDDADATAIADGVDSSEIPF